MGVGGMARVEVWPRISEAQGLLPHFHDYYCCPPPYGVVKRQVGGGGGLLVFRGVGWGGGVQATVPQYTLQLIHILRDLLSHNQNLHTHYTTHNTCPLTHTHTHTNTHAHIHTLFHSVFYIKLWVNAQKKSCRKNVKFTSLIELSLISNRNDDILVSRFPLCVSVSVSVLFFTQCAELCEASLRQS